MKTIAGISIGLIVATTPGPVPSAQSGAPARDCVTIGRPKPTAQYVYEHVESTGTRTQNTQQWEEITDKGFRLRATGSKGVEIVVNTHRIVDGVAVLDRTTKQTRNNGVLESTTFEPGLVSDPATRVCAGMTRQIPPVSARFTSPQVNHATSTPAGTLRVTSVQERITVPAGTFDTVHYTRTSQSTDEYWKSIEHGVVVKHIGRLPVGTVTDTLVAIR